METGTKTDQNVSQIYSNKSNRIAFGYASKVVSVQKFKFKNVLKKKIENCCVIYKR